MKSNNVKEIPVKLYKIKHGFTVVKLRGNFNDVIEREKPKEKKDE